MEQLGLSELAKGVTSHSSKPHNQTQSDVIMIDDEREEDIGPRHSGVGTNQNPHPMIVDVGRQEEGVMDTDRSLSRTLSQLRESAS